MSKFNAYSYSHSPARGLNFKLIAAAAFLLGVIALVASSKLPAGGQARQFEGAGWTPWQPAGSETNATGAPEEPTEPAESLLGSLWNMLSGEGISEDTASPADGSAAASSSSTNTTSTRKSGSKAFIQPTSLDSGAKASKSPLSGGSGAPEDNGNSGKGNPSPAPTTSPSPSPSPTASPTPTPTTDPDSDDDGLEDGDEIDRGTDPLDADTDDDGLTDGEEVNEFGTDPLASDTDGDGTSDGEEVAQGTDPNTFDLDWVSISDGITGPIDTALEDLFGDGPDASDADPFVPRANETVKPYKDLAEGEAKRRTDEVDDFENNPPPDPGDPVGTIDSLIFGENGIVATVDELISGENGLVARILALKEAIEGLLFGDGGIAEAGDDAAEDVQHLATSTVQDGSQDASAAAGFVTETVVGSVDGAEEDVRAYRAGAEEEADTALNTVLNKVTTTVESTQPLVDDVNSTVADAPKKLSEVLIGTYVVDSRDKVGISIPVLGGHTYKFKAAGTYTYADVPGPTGQYVADAECTSMPGDTLKPDRNVIGLKDGGDLVYWTSPNIDWKPVEGGSGCSSSNKYTSTFVAPSNNMVTFKIFQHLPTEYADNFGVLTLEVYEVALLPELSGMTTTSPVSWVLIVMVMMNLAARGIRAARFKEAADPTETI
ncbi:MAG TPA: hypothetical protein VNA87_02900 [Actinomycetota bacterium]|nr:hypothetical protein [Actinomycetota bacterium]